MCVDHHPPHPVLPIDVDSSVERLPLRPVDSLSILAVCDNVLDALLLDEGPAQRLTSRPGEPAMIDASALEEGKVIDTPLAAHGFSALVTFSVGDRTHRVLFDTGVTPTGCVDNLRRLGCDPGDVEVVVCSHGHYDHTTGLSGLLDVLGPANLPVVLHPEFWSRRRINIPGREPREIPTPSRRALEDAGFDIVEGRRPSFLFDGALLVTGEIDRTTSFETGFLVHEALRDGRWEPDPLILDDQALIANVAGKGLVVVTGCGHAGIVNIVRYAQRLTGVEQVHAVLGGFHLNGPLFEPIVEATCDGLAAAAPRWLIPSHCTGWKATHAIAARFPDAFIQNSVGTTYQFVDGSSG